MQIVTRALLRAVFKPCAEPRPPKKEMTMSAILSTTLIALAALGPIKQIDAGVLNIGYAEFGPATGTPVVLLHGWPYDIHSYEKVAPLLAAKGYHVIVP